MQRTEFHTVRDYEQGFREALALRPCPGFVNGAHRNGYQAGERYLKILITTKRVVILP